MSTHRHSAPGEHEHEFEAQPGLPEPLPTGERLLWQGGPDWRDLAIRAFHARKVTIYFALILLARGGFVLADGGSAGAALAAMAWLAPLAAFAVGTLVTLAWLTARTTVYTITSRRVVMRIGIVLTVTYNLPLSCLGGAGLRVDARGRGDVPIRVAGRDRIAWLHLWPHVRPWHVSQPQPMLRSLTDARHAAQVLTRAWQQVNGLGQALPSMASTVAAPGPAAVAPRARDAVPDAVAAL